MSKAATPATAGGVTKIFGFQIPVDPKILLSGLFAVVLGLGLYNFMGGGDSPGNSTPFVSAGKAVPPTLPSALNQNKSRRIDRASQSKQGVLRIRPVDPTRGDVDPTLRLWLLDRVRSVEPLEGGRNLFETGTEMAKALPPIPPVSRMTVKPRITAPPIVASAPPPPVPVNIPLRYYGFVKPSLRGDGNRGYFMEGDNILMATEGDVLESRFLVVALSPNTARIEDIQSKQGQDLQLIPEAISQ
jgi:hypothetical protein